MPHNRATIYSNGIADFQRVFPVKGGEKNKIIIPVRQQHLGDVLASLTVSGNVQIERPPSFQPANQDDGNIVIATTDSFTDLADQLAGADVELTIAKKSVTGKLVGVQDQEVGSEGEPITEQFLVVMNDEGLSKFSIRQIEKLFFTEESIRAEVTKALSRRLRDIKPNSTFVELELGTAESEALAVIQYTIPAAAWKISYRIILDENSAIELQGHAIVDNNTDEDWKDFMIAVVMGQPITFSTDIAESKTPQRNHVNVVQQSAFGSVEVEESMSDAMAEPMAYGSIDHMTNSAPAAPQRMMKRSTSERSRSASAAIQEAEITETGDFCIFESAQPVTIAARRSAIIPVFQSKLKQSKSVLHFKVENHSERPFRAIQFHNTTSHSLGRGVCTVYDQATYVGSCILPATQPDGTSLLPHALETAVRVRQQPNKIESRRIGIRISDGVAYESYHKLLRTEYLINSSRDNGFTFVLDHDVRLEQCKVACQLYRQSMDPVDLEFESLKNGRRIEFELLPNDVVKAVVVETCVSKSQIQLTGAAPADEKFHVIWLYDNLIDANSALIQDPAILRCVDLQKQLDEKNDQIKHAQAEMQRLNVRQERLRKNIAVGSGDHQTAKWQDDLGRAEDNLVQLEEEHLPELTLERDECRRDLFAALKNLTIEWSE